MHIEVRMKKTLDRLERILDRVETRFPVHLHSEATGKGEAAEKGDDEKEGGDQDARD